MCTERFRLRPYPFNIFLSDLVSTLDKSDIYNFADGITISSISKRKDIPFTTLENESEKAIDWFRLNNMIEIFEKFQSLILQKSGCTETLFKLMKS